MQSDLQTIVQENLYFIKRKELLSQIESKLSNLFSKKTAVAAYIANTLMPGFEAVSSMNLTHVAYVDDLIRVAANREGVEAVALIVETYGGEATFPSELMRRARTYCKEFYVIVVNVAKSAGTLLALLSDKIIAVQTASFGPVDPQLVFTTPQGPQTVSARSIKDMMENTIPTYIRDKSPAEKAAILASQNYGLYQQALDGLRLVEEAIDNELRPRIEATKLNEIKQELVHAPLSHAVNKTIDDLERLGLNVCKLTPDSEVGRLLIEYHRRAFRNLIAEAQGGIGFLLFESTMSSYQFGVARVQQAGPSAPPLVPQPSRSRPQAPPGPPAPAPQTEG
jgi:hypothetical protein